MVRHEVLRLGRQSGIWARFVRTRGVVQRGCRHWSASLEAFDNAKGLADDLSVVVERDLTN